MLFRSTVGWAQRKSRMVPHDNPGRPGNDRVRLVVPIPLNGTSPCRSGAAFTSSSGDGRTSPYATKELRGKGRSETVPSRVSGPERFRSRISRSHPKGARLLLRASTGMPTLARHSLTGCAPNERHRKVGQTERLVREAECHGKASRFQSAGDAKSTAGL